MNFDDHRNCELAHNSYGLSFYVSAASWTRYNPALECAFAPKRHAVLARRDMKAVSSEGILYRLLMHKK
ncbi:hypothetical protein A2952_02680 [Candidatus Kaiserbacteria bacterium RIFCSPLOWO2_01_FULL_59_34]|nr:MAG: hypothetical protein A2952_02680 [Candidatus Kaiserbacteria bacterium RIFCSPLOWO2_01_FULL_59_34]